MPGPRAMRPYHETAEEALVYLTDCTLATVEDLVGRSRPPKHETRRQIVIAQSGVDVIRRLGLAADGRSKTIIETSGGDVAAHYDWPME